MVILGLGSNLGDRVENLKAALRELVKTPRPVLENIRVSPLYESQALLPEKSEASWDLPFLNMAVAGETTLSPAELLKSLKDIEARRGRDDRRRWAPRPLDIDILAWGDLSYHDENITIPHPGLLQRPFALLPLAQVAPFWVHPQVHKTALSLTRDISGMTPRARLFNIPTPKIVGILNITPDSFSDGGIHESLEDSLKRARELVSQGATVLDVGAESTRPGATPLPAHDEIKRLKPFLKDLPARVPGFGRDYFLSVDTRHGMTAAMALEAGAHWINDVTGFESEDMIAAVRDSSCGIVVMHHLGVPPTKDKTLPEGEDPVSLVLAWGRERLGRLIDRGLDSRRIIFDPGIGFGKTPDQNVALLRELRRMHSLGCPLLIGPSRKSFFSTMTEIPAPGRDLETAVLSALIGDQGFDYIRVHEPQVIRRALKVAASVHGAYA